MRVTSYCGMGLMAIPVESFQFLPDVAVRVPLGGRLSGDVGDGLVEGAVAIGADEGLARRGEESGAAPASAFDRHPKAAETGAATGALVPDDQDQQANGKQPEEEDGDGPGQVVGEPGETGVEKDFGFREEGFDEEPEEAQNRSGGQELGEEEAPVFHRPAPSIPVRRRGGEEGS